MKTLTSLAILALAITLATSAQAEFKMATIDMGEIINASPDAKAAKAALDTATEQAKAEIEKKQVAIKPLQEKAKSGKLEKGSKDAEQLRKLTQELVTSMREKEDELKAMFAKSNKSLTEKTTKVVEKYAKDNKINIVLDRSKGARSPVLYGEAAIDITEDVAKLLNS